MKQLNVALFLLFAGTFFSTQAAQAIADFKGPMSFSSEEQSRENEEATKDHNCGCWCKASVPREEPYTSSYKLFRLTSESACKAKEGESCTTIYGDPGKIADCSWTGGYSEPGLEPALDR